ncbi:hypothetical protein B484DRAFT_443248 [Ochromonadaceae sp. CCMP2298]|nr:hypothetical protein B484DRAFT_443248 [Ochromonadaceae sp. CCMP2298]
MASPTACWAYSSAHTLASTPLPMSSTSCTFSFRACRLNSLVVLETNSHTFTTLRDSLFPSSYCSMSSRTVTALCALSSMSWASESHCLCAAPRLPGGFKGRG